MRFAGLCLLAAALALGIGCSRSDNKVAARIGKDTITVKMIKQQYLDISPSARPDLKTIDEKESFIKDIVAKQILWLEARKLGLDRLPEVANAGTQAVSSRAWQTYFEEQVRSQVKVTEADIQNMYAKQAAGYHVAWIFVRSRSLADDIEQRLRAGENFAALAAAYSVDMSRAQGGDAGVRNLGSLPAPIEDKIMTMAPGETSGVIAFDSYYAIVKLIEKQPAEQQPIEQVRSGLEALVKASQENTQQRKLAGDLKKAYELTFNQATVDMIVAKTRALYPTPDAPVGAMPQFSDEELDRDLAKWKGGSWKVRNYAESIGRLRDFMRPGYGADRETIESVIGDFITGELWAAELKSKGYESKPEALRAGQRAVEQAALTALHDQLVKEVTVDDSKLETFYKDNKDKLVTEPGVKIAVVVAKDETGAKAAYDQLQAGTKFETVAKQQSVDQVTAQNGGAVPRPLYKQDLDQFPDLQGVLENLQVGSYSTPMPVPPGFGAEGYMIVKLLERLPPRQLELAEIKEYLTPQVLALEQDKVFGEWLKSKMDEYKVEIFPDAIATVDFTPLKNQEQVS